MKTCPLFFNAHVQNTPSIRHFDAILASYPGTFDLFKPGAHAMYSIVFWVCRVYVLQNIEKLIKQQDIIRNFSVFKLFNLGSFAQRSGYDIV